VWLVLLSCLVVAVAAVAVRGMLRAPASGGRPAASPSPSPTRMAVPALWPTPRTVVSRPGVVRVTASVRLTVGAGVDDATATLVRTTLQSAGARTVTGGGSGAGLTVSLGVGASDHTMSPYGIRGTSGLPSGGYVLALDAGSGGAGPRVLLDGRDALGTYYAAQTLAQLVRPVGAPAARSALPAVAVRDWPAAAVRGVVEGFYGTAWSPSDRLAQLDFDGRFKLDSYLYTPKDDPYLRERWQDPYPSAQLATLHVLFTRGTADHVAVTYVLSPGLSICYSSAADRERVLAKLEQVWRSGARSFAIALDDIDYKTWNCDADRRTYGTDPGAPARAQSDLLNHVLHDFIDKHPGAAPLTLVPSEYGGLSHNAYKSALATALDPAIAVVWTGPQVVSTTVDRAQIDEAHAIYRHPVVVWDNYPVNDYTPGHLLLGPYTGRTTGLLDDAHGLLANPMPQATASDPVLFSLADYTWNPGSYRPDTTLDAGLSALAGGNPTALAALRAFADLNHDSRIDATAAPALAADIAAYWRDPSGAVGPLRDRLTLIAAAGHDITDPSFRSEAAPWLTTARQWADASLAALQLLKDARSGHPTTSDPTRVQTLRTQAQSHTVPNFQGIAYDVHVGGGVFETFIARALRTAG
jgi:hyaluronoglucosaminidase